MSKKNGITLIALVITIIIMLLLAAVAIQMAMGENGLIAKSVQAQKQQAKSELYENAKLSYTNLKVKALENGQPIPEAYLALATTEFRDKYDIVGDDITDKNGNVIDTKSNIITTLKLLNTTTDTAFPKNIGGIEIPVSDKNKMILKLKILSEKERISYGKHGTFFNKITEIDYGNGNTEQITDLYVGRSIEYNRGEYIVKIDGILQLGIGLENYSDNFEIEVLQWGKIDESGLSDPIGIKNVAAIHEPEPDKIPIKYYNAKFSEIPEWLFSKKVTAEYMSLFKDCKNITSIPENLFKECRNAKYFYFTFDGCTGITSIPENLFKYNTNLEYMNEIFSECTELTNIPSRLISNNSQLKEVENMFAGCKKIIDIPTNIIQDGIKLKERGGRAWRMFKGCTAANNYSIIPDDLK